MFATESRQTHDQSELQQDTTSSATTAGDYGRNVGAWSSMLWTRIIIIQMWEASFMCNSLV